MRTLALLLVATLGAAAGQTWTNSDLGLEITFPDDWAIQDGQGARDLRCPLLDPLPDIVMSAHAPGGGGGEEEEDGTPDLYEAIQVEVCEDTFGSNSSIASTFESNGKDVAFVGVGIPRIRHCNVGSATLGDIECVRCTVQHYRVTFELHHVLYAFRLQNKKAVILNCMYREDDATRPYEKELDEVVQTTKCSKVLAPMHVAAAGVGVVIGLLVIVLLIVVVAKVRSTPPPPPPVAPPPPPQTA